MIDANELLPKSEQDARDVAEDRRRLAAEFPHLPELKGNMFCRPLQRKAAQAAEETKHGQETEG